MPSAVRLASQATEPRRDSVSENWASIDFSGTEDFVFGQVIEIPTLIRSLHGRDRDCSGLFPEL
mgnify:CR=1 FL=1